MELRKQTKAFMSERVKFISVKVMLTGGGGGIVKDGVYVSTDDSCTNCCLKVKG